MRGATSPMFPLRLTLKIYWPTGSLFEQLYSLEQTTFAQVKSSALRFFKPNDQRRSSVSQYKLISIVLKRSVDDEQRTLSDARVRDGDEYLLVRKTTQRDKTFGHCSIDPAMIEYRTDDLPPASHSFNRECSSVVRSEFHIDLYRILFHLVGLSEKLLGCHPDAERIFRQAEGSSLFDRDGPFRADAKAKEIQALTEIGFAHDQVVTTLRIFHNDPHRACEYLLSDDREQGLDVTSSIFQAILQNADVQKTLHHPKTFFILLRMVESPASIIHYLNDPQIGKMLLQISRIYHAEKGDADLSRTMVDSSSTDFDEDSD